MPEKQIRNKRRRDDLEQWRKEQEARVGTADKIWMSSEVMTSITGSCGHTVPFEDAFVAIDKYECPECGIQWHITSAPPKVLASGFVLPGRRTIHTEPQLSLPLKRRSK